MKKEGFFFKHGLKIAALLLVVGMGLLLVSLATLFGKIAGDGSRVIDFEVRQGTGSGVVARELERERLIDDAMVFKLLLRLTFRASDVKAGLYRLNNGMSISEIADLLTEGKVKMTTFTVPEGWNNRQIAAHLAERGLVKDREEFLKFTKDPMILKKYNIPADSTEGYLFPETYTIPVGYSADRIHEAMIRRFFLILDEVAPDARSNPTDLFRTLILASIIEREAKNRDELPIMAGVFLNRVHKNMRLESCATIQYLLPKPREKLYDRDLQISSPYNTYKNAGLPPGPISNPGRPALKAAFDPDENDYLFFVLKPDNSHFFSSNYNDHLVAKRKYLGE